MTDKLKELLPCPFCGSDPRADDGFMPCESIKFAWCSNQDCFMSNGVDMGITVDAWNSRAPLPAVEAAEIEVAGFELCVDGYSPVLIRDEAHASREFEYYKGLGMKVTLNPLSRRILAGVNQQAGSGWIACADRLPESGRTVLAHYLNSFGNDRRIRAQHVKAWTILAEYHADPDTECVEYSEQEDAYYLLEGWYECIDNWDEYYRVQVNEGPITHWMQLPPSPADKADA